MLRSVLASTSSALLYCAQSGALAARLYLRYKLEGRSSKWSALEKSFKKDHPRCECCGSKSNLIVHHKVPFHVDPSLELVRSNLKTLCENKTLNCHLWFGHLGNFQSYNSAVDLDCIRFYGTLLTRPIIPFSPEK